MFSEKWRKWTRCFATIESWEISRLQPGNPSGWPSGSGRFNSSTYLKSTFPTFFGSGWRLHRSISGKVYAINWLCTWEWTLQHMFMNGIHGWTVSRLCWAVQSYFLFSFSAAKFQNLVIKYLIWCTVFPGRISTNFWISSGPYFCRVDSTIFFSFGDHLQPCFRFRAHVRVRVASDF